MGLQLTRMNVNWKYPWRYQRKLLLLAVAGLMILAVTGCSPQVREVFLDSLVEGVTTTSNPEELGGVSETYLIKIEEGVQHYIHLGNPDNNIAGIWDVTENDFIIQASPATQSRTITYTSSEGGFHEIYLLSLDSDIRSPFTFKIFSP